jgi:hypothetical protein
MRLEAIAAMTNNVLALGGLFATLAKYGVRFNYNMFENLCAANEFWAKPGQHCLAQGKWNRL